MGVLRVSTYARTFYADGLGGGRWVEYPLGDMILPGWDPPPGVPLLEAIDSLARARIGKLLGHRWPTRAEAAYWHAQDAVPVVREVDLSSVPWTVPQ